MSLLLSLHFSNNSKEDMFCVYRNIYGSTAVSSCTGKNEGELAHAYHRCREGEDITSPDTWQSVTLYAPSSAIYTRKNCKWRDTRLLATSHAQSSGDNFLGGEPGRHFLASFFAAIVNFPLWRAAAMGNLALLYTGLM